MPDWIQLLFAFSGRINRAKFWLLPLAMLIPLLPMFVLAVVNGSFEADGSAASRLWLIPVGLLIIATAIVSLSCTVRRLHDRGRTGHWAWFFFVLPAALGFIDGAGGNTDKFSVFTAASLIISLWYVVECGFLRGAAGPNQYGADPLATKAAPRTA